MLTYHSLKNNNTESVTQDLIKLFNSQANATDRISKQSQLKPILMESFNNETYNSSTGCVAKICQVWMNVVATYNQHSDIIGNASSPINILIPNEEIDSQTKLYNINPVEAIIGSCEPTVRFHKLKRFIKIATICPAGIELLTYDTPTMGIASILPWEFTSS